jgi:hypothetical protein
MRRAIRREGELIMPKQLDPKKIISDLFEWTDQYLRASAALEQDKDTFIPRAQIRGLLLELAFKTLLASRGVYRKGHDLELLAEECTQYGLSLSEHESRFILAPLQRSYCYDTDLVHGYLSRYPMEDRPTVIWTTPSHESLDGLVSRILELARAADA